MKCAVNQAEKTLEMRQRAEACVQQRGAAGQSARHDHAKLLHELQVHQVELEMQNAELVQAREETERLLESYTELYDFAPVGYFTLGSNGTIRSSNLAGADMLRVERSALLGRSFLTFVASQDRPRWAAFVEKIDAGGAEHAVELGLVQPGQGGRTLAVKIQASCAPGRTCRIAAVDITTRKEAEEELRRQQGQLEWLVAERTRSLQAEILERKRAEQELVELNATLEQRVAERTEELSCSLRDLTSFSYSVSHDLRAPLRGINSLASMLIEDLGPRLGGEAEAMARTIVQRTVAMSRMIDDLLSFSRTSRQQLSLRPIDMTRLAWEQVEMLGVESDCKVSFRVAELSQALGDPAMVAQVLQNLFCNAIKFSRNRQQPVVEVGSFSSEHEVVYFVRDNGVGFDMKYLESIFTIFQRLHVAEEFEGSGVGLAIAKQIVIRHGGRIWAESQPEEGATFFFSLPKG